jgi:hypothetical protein
MVIGIAVDIMHRLTSLSEHIFAVFVRSIVTLIYMNPQGNTPMDYAEYYHFSDGMSLLKCHHGVSNKLYKASHGPSCVVQ